MEEHRYERRVVVSSPGGGLGLLAFYLAIGLVIGFLFTSNPFLLLLFAVAWPMTILVAGLATIWFWIVMIVGIIGLLLLIGWLFGD